MRKLFNSAIALQLVNENRCTCDPRRDRLLQELIREVLETLGRGDSVPVKASSVCLRQQLGELLLRQAEHRALLTQQRAVRVATSTFRWPLTALTSPGPLFIASFPAPGRLARLATNADTLGTWARFLKG